MCCVLFTPEVHRVLRGQTSAPGPLGAGAPHTGLTPRGFLTAPTAPNETRQPHRGPRGAPLHPQGGPWAPLTVCVPYEMAFRLYPSPPSYAGPTALAVLTTPPPAPAPHPLPLRPGARARLPGTESRLLPLAPLTWPGHVPLPPRRHGEHASWGRHPAGQALAGAPSTPISHLLDAWVLYDPIPGELASPSRGGFSSKQTEAPVAAVPPLHLPQDPQGGRGPHRTPHGPPKRHLVRPLH